MSTQVLIVVLLGLVCFGAIAYVLLSPTEKDKASKRLSSMQTPGQSRRGGAQASTDASAKERRKKLADTLDAIDSQQKDLKKKNQLTLDQMLEQTGLPVKKNQFYMASVGAAFIFAIIGLVSGQQLWITGLLFAVGGLGFPRWVVNFLRTRRQKKFVAEFSNAIDVIVRGVKSGLPVNECLKIIGREAPRPVSDEFHMLTEGLRLGMTMDHALERMYHRMPLQEVNFFGIVLLIQQKTGGNLAEALGNLSHVLRSRKLMEGKIKALSAEAKASAYIIGSLPFLVMGAVKLASPDYLDPLFTTQMGNFILIGSGLWMGTGILVMRKMIQIKV